MKDNYYRMMMMEHRGHFIVCRKHQLVMTSEEVLMFSYLANVGAMAEDRAGKRVDWFRCSGKQLMNGVQCSSRHHKRVLGSLVKKGFVSRKMTGNPPHRRIRIDFEELNKAIYEKLEMMFNVS